MDREQFIKQMTEYGDAQVFFRGPVSNKLKYNVVTLDLDNPHIKSRSKGRIQKEIEGRVLTFAWDTDDFRQIDPSNVVRIVPLNEAMDRAMRHGR